MSSPPAVSVVIPTRNRARLFLEAGQSALLQALPAIEALVAGDGTPDVRNAARVRGPASQTDRVAGSRRPRRNISSLLFPWRRQGVCRKPRFGWAKTDWGTRGAGPNC